MRLGQALVLVASIALPASAATMPAPATPSYVRGDRAAEDAACRRCHRASASEHEGSLHARSFSDSSFQRGYAIEPQAFCRSCHAPEASPGKAPDAFAALGGVACVTCHVPTPGGPVLVGGDGPSLAPHPIARVADFGTRACAGCHEFAFPNAALLADAGPSRGSMQKTLREHAASAARDRSCASCHMPTGGHRFAASRDPARLAAALDVKVERSAGGGVVFTLTAKDVGHAFPTGDLFRRLVLRVGRIEQAFGRSFRAERTPSGAVARYESRDDRLVDVKRVTLPPLPAGTAWEVVYQRVTGVAQTPPFAVEVEAEEILARGAI